LSPLGSGLAKDAHAKPLTKGFSAPVKPFVRRVFEGEAKTFIRALGEDFGRHNAARLA
jgi:hypothetical protein